MRREWLYGTTRWVRLWNTVFNEFSPDLILASLDLTQYESKTLLTTAKSMTKDWPAHCLYLAVLMLLFSTYNNRAIALKYSGYSLALVTILLLFFVDAKNTLRSLNTPIYKWLLLFLGINAMALLQVDSAYRMDAVEHYRKGLLQAGLLATAIALSLTNLARIKWGIWVFGLASLHITFFCLNEIVNFPVQNAVLDHATLYRDYCFRFIFYFPFLIVLFATTGWPIKAVWLFLPSLQLALLAFSGFRGSWIGFLVIVAQWLFFFRPNRRIFISVAALMVLSAVAASSSNYVLMKFKQTDTGARWDGAWRATVDMIRDKPIVGHGLSSQVFREENNRLADQHPSWVIGKNLTGPHSIFLDSAFSAGLPALGVLLAIYWLVIRDTLWVIRTTANQALRRYAVASLCSFVGFFVVLGLTESLRWELLGLSVGLTMSLVKVARNLEPSGRIR